MRSTFCVLVLSAAIAAEATPAEDNRLAEARAVTLELVQTLGKHLKTELGQSGPDGAIAVCRTIAPALAGSLSQRTGWRISRVSLKPRNALLGTPDAWEQQVLQDFERRAAAGEKAEALEFAEIVEEPAGRYYRYMKALPVQPLCTTCHGTAETIPASVRDRLRADYPRDAAIGYGVGQIRGAVTIKQALEEDAGR